MRRAAFGLTLLSLVGLVFGARNVTIDDSDLRVVYAPDNAWTREVDTPDRFNQTITHSFEIGATASLTFTNSTKVYYYGFGMMELSPALVPVTLNGIVEMVDLFRPEGSQAQALFYTSPDLDPTEEYTISIEKTGDTLQHWVNLDAFILTQPEESDASTTSESESSTASEAATSGSSESGESSSDPSLLFPTNLPPPTNRKTSTLNVGAIAGGVVGAVVALLTIATFIIVYLKKKAKKERGENTSDTLRASSLATKEKTFQSGTQQSYNPHSRPDRLSQYGQYGGAALPYAGGAHPYGGGGGGWTTSDTREQGYGASRPWNA